MAGNLSNLTILVVGMGSVLLTFVILYIIFVIMGKVFTSRQRKIPKAEAKTTQTFVKSEEKVDQDETMEAAIVGAGMAYMSSESKIVMQPKGRIFSFEERTTSWRKSGWKGARGWRASSGW
jgi:Na+-transporting methylmalonyl-CoA/oxaloacetate decarboxylase gamma subunit